MRKAITISIVAGLMVIAGLSGRVDAANVTIKVRALNPLETTETAKIYYPLPKELSKKDILNQTMTYSQEHPDEEEPRKTRFEIIYNEEEHGYYIDDEVLLSPKEVVTLQVHVRDIWVIDEALIESLRAKVFALFDAWEARREMLLEAQANAQEAVEEEMIEGQEAEGDVVAQIDVEETQEVALSLKAEILNGLDRMGQRQYEHRIVKVGVERHIEAFDKNIDDLRQVQEDLLMLENLTTERPKEEEVVEPPVENEAGAQDAEAPSVEGESLEAPAEVLEEVISGQ